MIGTGLFDFGDIDGPVKTARLQHPLGIAWTNAGLVIADTYNNKVKVFSKDLSLRCLRPDRGRRQEAVRAWRAGSRGGWTPLLVADADNHRLLRVPVRDGQLQPREASAITVTGAPHVTSGVALSGGSACGPENEPLTQELAPSRDRGGKTELTLVLTAPPATT